MIELFFEQKEQMEKFFSGMKKSVKSFLNVTYSLIKKILRFVLRFLFKLSLYFFAAIGLVSFMVAGTGAFFALGHYQDLNATRSLPDSMILVIDMDEIGKRAEPVCLVFDRKCPVTVTDFITTLEAASKDKTVKGLLVLSQSRSMPGLGEIRAMRDAVKTFADEEKATWFYARDLGAFGNGTMDYYLASAFDHIVMPPSGGVGLSGISIDIPLVKEALQRFDIVPYFEERYEYKGAVTSLVASSVPVEQRENMQSLLDSLYRNIYSSIRFDRNLSRIDLDDGFERLTIDAELALEEKFIDGISYFSELEDYLNQKIQPEKVEYVEFARYRHHQGQDEKPEGDEKNIRVAVINARGSIIDGGSGNAFDDFSNITPASLIPQLEKAREDDDIDAVLLVVSSPGGSYAASDEIWHQVKKTAQEKPVVAMMENVAASGGYFIAMGADKIVAQPTTLTGSIGVVAGGVGLRDFFARWGVSFERIESNTPGGPAPFNVLDTPDIVSQNEFALAVDRIYEDFTEKVAQSRNFTPGEIDSVARGRVWTGEQAYNNRLIDKLGGLPEARTLLRELLEKPEDTTIELISDQHLPEEWFERALLLVESRAITGPAFLPLLRLFSQRGLTVPPELTGETALTLPYFLISD